MENKPSISRIFILFTRYYEYDTGKDAPGEPYLSEIYPLAIRSAAV
jgi:hypothetical protein